jgi:hypothetical protein
MSLCLWHNIKQQNLQTVHLEKDLFRAIVSGDYKPTLTRLWVVGATAVMGSVEYFKLEKSLHTVESNIKVTVV